MLSDVETVTASSTFDDDEELDACSIFVDSEAVCLASETLIDSLCCTLKEAPVCSETEWLTFVSVTDVEDSEIADENSTEVSIRN